MEAGPTRSGGNHDTRHLRYAAADLENDWLADALGEAGFDLAAPAVVSCLGVLVYLRTETVQRPIRFAGGLSGGSELVFTYSTRDQESRLAARAAALGEPWQSASEPDEWRRRLSDAGFSQVELVPPDTIGSWYFAGRTDGLAAPRRGSIAHAVV